MDSPFSTSRRSSFLGPSAPAAPSSLPFSSSPAIARLLRRWRRHRMLLAASLSVGASRAAARSLSSPSPRRPRSAIPPGTVPTSTVESRRAHSRAVERSSPVGQRSTPRARDCARTAPRSPPRSSIMNAVVSASVTAAAANAGPCRRGAVVAGRRRPRHRDPRREPPARRIAGARIDDVILLADARRAERRLAH